MARPRGGCAPGVHWYFGKAPLVLRGGAQATVSVAGTGQAVAWVPGSVWTAGVPPDLTRWAVSSVTLQGCPDRPVLFLGGILAADLTTCVVLRVASTRHAEVTV